MDISRQLGFLFAPPAGAILVALLGPAAPMLFNGVGALLAAVCVFFIRWRPPERERQRSEGLLNAVQRVVDESFEGMRTIGRSRLLQVALLLGASLNLVIAPIQLLLPLFVFDVKDAGESYYGGLVAALLIGIIGGALSAPGLSRRHGLGRLTITSIVLLGTMICVAPWPPTLWPPAFGMAIAGACLGALNFAQTTMVQGATSDEERGRVSATYFTATLGARPFGFLVMGALASAVDIRFLFLSVGILALLIGGVLVRLPEVRQAH
jgi:MFS family permease